MHHRLHFPNSHRPHYARSRERPHSSSALRVSNAHDPFIYDLERSAAADTRQCTCGRQRHTNGRLDVTRCLVIAATALILCAYTTVKSIFGDKSRKEASGVQKKCGFRGLGAT